MTARAERDFWDILQIVGSVAGAVATPIIVLILGVYLNGAVRESEVNARLLELSVRILQEKPSEEGQVPEIRRWALDVFERVTGELSLPVDVKDQIQDTALPGADIQCCVTCDGVTVCGRTVHMSCGSCGPAPTR